MEHYLLRNRVFLGKNIFISGVKLSLTIKHKIGLGDKNILNLPIIYRL